MPVGPLFLRFFPEDYGELGLAGFGGVVEGRPFAVGIGGTEEESLLGIFGEADEAGFTVGVGSDLKVELVEIHESISDMDTDIGGVDWLADFVGYDEIRSARAQAGVDFGDGFRVHFRVCWMGGLGVRPCRREKQQRAGKGESDGVSKGGSHTFIRSLLDHAKGCGGIKPDGGPEAAGAHWHSGFRLPTFVAASGVGIYNFWNCHSSMP